MFLINSGDTAFIILCTAMVCLMTPGLALFYGGLVCEKNIVSIITQNFICMGVIAVIWIFGGFGLAFGPTLGGVIGNPLSYFGMIHIGVEPDKIYAPKIPFMLFFAYQMMFAIITPALITGAIVGRVKFSAYIKFIILWMLFVYIPVAHWVWGGGFLSKLGVVDFAGGIVVHTTAGFSALVAASFIGKSIADDKKIKPASLPIVACGAGLLWFGWFGFNSGGAYAADALASYAFINTTVAGSVAMLGWLYWNHLFGKKITLSATLVGSVIGLATITPAAGYVEPWSAVLIGLIGSTVCFFAKKIQSYLNVDDTLEVWRAHGVGGATGAILIGVFASKMVGGIHYSFHQIFIQAVGVIFVAIYAIGITLIILKVLSRNGGLRVDGRDESIGLDESEHGEDAYSIKE
ncbi:ammonium transporter [Edwardsiella tarda]|uniref:ammonium transporter n=1 Tax=Edwardsiella tarda TaxID=636 RepID=UPI0002D8FA13|nr:ammonium transporter [Edwardsiella tarda]